MAFPNLCCIGASWDVDMIYRMGEALGDDCLSGGVSMLLAPGVNIKRHILCGRNFEYLAEDPVLAGEMAAAYINGLQSKGVAASLKHFAMNNQEAYRTDVSVEVDMRTMMEIYLKPFEIAVKKSDPVSVMCAYNKVFSIWCSENRFLLTDVLRKKWGYDGFVVSDWGAVHDICRCIRAGLDLEMPPNSHIVEQIREGLSSGALTEEELDRAVERILRFVGKEPLPVVECDRIRQHRVAQELAASGIVLLKNEGALPLTKEKNKKIAVVGEYAKDPLVFGQGSAEVWGTGSFIDSPLDELRTIVGDDYEIEYFELYKKSVLPADAPWRLVGQFQKDCADCDTVVFFVGTMAAEDTEMFDRKSARLNGYYEMFIEETIKRGKRVVVVIQSGSAMILGDWHKKADAIVQMWLGGEGAGRAIAEVLTGQTNPSGKLTETFPSRMPTHLNYPGDGIKLHYSEGMDVGYRYYDKHPEEVNYPFGHGLSYTTFDYSELSVEIDDQAVTVQVTITNTGSVYGGEVVQLYVSKKGGTVDCPIKELKGFRKVFLEPGQDTRLDFVLPLCELGYYNTLLADWVVEKASYEFLVAASATDIRLSETRRIEPEMPYTIDMPRESMIG